jgi:hypothetical protein
MLKVPIKIYVQLHRVFKAVDLGSGRGASVLGLALLLPDFTKKPGIFIGIERDFRLYAKSLELQSTLSEAEPAQSLQVKLTCFHSLAMT